MLHWTDNELVKGHFHAAASAIVDIECNLCRRKSQMISSHRKRTLKSDQNWNSILDWGSTCVDRDANEVLLRRDHKECLDSFVQSIELNEDDHSHHYECTTNEMDSSCSMLVVMFVRTEPSQCTHKSISIKQYALSVTLSARHIWFRLIKHITRNTECRKSNRIRSHCVCVGHRSKWNKIEEMSWNACVWGSTRSWTVSLL